MKKLIFTFLTFSLISFYFSNSSIAQPYKINLYNSYVFDDGVDATLDNGRYIRGTINGNYQWGVGFEYILKQTYGIELMYNRQNTEFPVTYTSNLADTNRTYDVDINYILIGGNKYLPLPGQSIKPFGGIMLGVAILNNQNPPPGAESSTTNFAWSARLGSDFMFSPNVGIRLQAQLQSAVQDIGGGVYLGTGGVSTGINTESSMYQFGLGGALIIQFGQPKTRIRR
ncbi:MAG TPA: porin family protein [Ignavibacteria bacterium]|nr:porin family protein [Ignavibacteria bacterium]HMR39261.1 porin family protein [Ignavibacteria bacterium]